MTRARTVDIRTIRRLNLSVLLDGYDQQKDFAAAIGTTESYLSQVKKGALRGMGDRTARKIEEKLHKPRGWMDQPQGWTRELLRPELNLPLDDMDAEDLAMLRSLALRLIASKDHKTQ